MNLSPNFIFGAGELIIMHDRSVNRTTNGRGNIQDLSLAQLKQLQAGPSPGEQIPTFSEVLPAFLFLTFHLFVSLLNKDIRLSMDHMRSTVDAVSMA